MDIRTAISIVERFQPPEPHRISADMIIDALRERDDPDFTNTWLVRGLEAVDWRVTPAIHADIEKALLAAQEAIQPVWVQEDALLWRGFTEAPRGDLGVHWADTRRHAERHGSYIVSARVQNASIDWIGTLIRRICWPKEHEVSLVRGGPIEVLGIEHEGRPVAGPHQRRA